MGQWRVRARVGEGTHRPAGARGGATRARRAVCRSGQGRGNARLDAAARHERREGSHVGGCLLYTSDAADERSSVDLGGRRIIKKKNKKEKKKKTIGHQV